MLIYTITNRKNGKRYIGKALNFKQRMQSHLSLAKRGAPQPLYKAMRKYGIEQFEFSILQECTSLEEMDNREAFWIMSFDTFKGRGYNQSAGGGGSLGYKHSKDARARIGQAARGRSLSKEARKRMSAAHTGANNSQFGKKHSETHRQKISEGLRLAYEEGRASTPSSFGAKLGASNKGRKLSNTHKQKISRALRGRPKSETHKIALRKPRKK